MSDNELAGDGAPHFFVGVGERADSLRRGRAGLRKYRHAEARQGVPLKIVEHFFLAFSHPDLVQTSDVQAVNGTTGAAMSLIKKSAVKNHLSTRTGASSLPPGSSKQPDATGYSGKQSAGAAHASSRSPSTLPIGSSAAREARAPAANPEKRKP